MHAEIRAVSTYLPSQQLTNEQLADMFPEWSVDKIGDKTGILNRHIANEAEFSSDLGLEACKKLLRVNNLAPDLFDYLIVVTQTPDHLLPGIASKIHHQLQLNLQSGAIDVNLGCSGYVYALGIAKGLIASSQAKNILLVTSDTYSKILNPGDKSVRTIFGDGATATWISSNLEQEKIGGLVYGTDGSGANYLFAPSGGLKEPGDSYPPAMATTRNLEEHKFNLYMNGPEIFNFTISIAEKTISSCLEKANVQMQEIDFFVFHQANAFMLDHLRRKLKISNEKFPILMSDFGNTVSGTIPMALDLMFQQKTLRPGSKILCMGFGVGLSWGAALVTI